jgi:hypothetical protein
MDVDPDRRGGGAAETRRSGLDPLEITDAEYRAARVRLRDQKERGNALRASFLAGVAAGLRRAAEECEAERQREAREAKATLAAGWDRLAGTHQRVAATLEILAARLRAIDPASVKPDG